MATKRDNFIGWIGALSVVAAYALLTFEVTGAKDVLYNVLNLIGGICLCYRVWIDRNYSNVFLEIVFVSVALYALAKILVF
jgi:uncharacterized membrane protein YhaH (DUF805 family)